ncbi:MAG: three-Cys-motif partner protein TcmP [Candidatus Thiodiazotropha endolucinida]|uniref:Three-Cys-motif partner protein TcmP n=1 Tax=Candidatus Thiodiazotropha taylori TaxID=2792791 RepID=A0A9E4TTG9_9GAMM|nr:three-Cys-motif partner protein TcmP [Candidatus Thiodiazotropha taylori]MCW4236082.1 three-Cys-motif partner protein TcmP [Candidatus Thiodiazotropha endolucinida]
MVSKTYDWEHGAKLEDHTRKKHEILKRYFREYLLTRCKMPQQEKFRIAIVDGFCGGGLYECGSPGSPLLFIEGLLQAAIEINTERHQQGMKPIVIEGLLIFNDSKPSVIELLQKNLIPCLLEVEAFEHLQIEINFYTDKFEAIYPQIKQRLIAARCRNVFFNLDQCGYSKVTSSILRDIISSWNSAEILFTFMIESMLAFLSPDKSTNSVPIEPVMKKRIDGLLKNRDNLIGKKDWLAEAEQIAFAYLKDCATYVSPFSINNPSGWQYWLMHFATSYRARQVYNDVLHQCNAQAHFGRSGLNMLSYDPAHEGQLYLFDIDSRQAAKNALYDDIPRFVAESGDAISMHDFYAAAYSETPAHSEDIHEMIMENIDIVVITETGGTRRKANTIKPTDTLKMKDQKSFIFMFPNEQE